MLGRRHRMRSSVLHQIQENGSEAIKRQQAYNRDLWIVLLGGNAYCFRTGAL
jgi:hypothetical protein